MPAMPAGRQEPARIASDIEPAGPMPAAAVGEGAEPFAPEVPFEGVAPVGAAPPRTDFSTCSSAFSEAGESLVVSAMDLNFCPMVAPGFLSPVRGGALGSSGSWTTVASSLVSTETTSPLDGLRFWWGSSAAVAGRRVVSTSAAAVTAAGSTVFRGEVIGLALLRGESRSARGKASRLGGNALVSVNLHTQI